MTFIAALPMYDWPEMRAETDAQWAGLCEVLRTVGIEAPDRLVRRNADMAAVPGGITDGEGRVIAPDPATLPPDEFDMQTLWRHPALLFAQTCWGPMEAGLAEHVGVVGQPDYSDCAGGRDAFYSSAIVMRMTNADDVTPPGDGRAALPVDAMHGQRLAFNGPDSMSGILALDRDLASSGESLDLFGERIQSGSHRASIIAVAEGRADVCAIDCRSWQLARRFEPAASEVAVFGWTAQRKGLPFITSRHTPDEIVVRMRAALADTGSVLPVA